MLSCDLLPNCRGEEPDKCEVCPQAKYVEMPFNYVHTELLSLVYSNFCDLKGFDARGGSTLSLSLMTSADTLMCSC